MEEINNSNKPEEPDVPKIPQKKKRVYRRKKKEEDSYELDNMEFSEEHMKEEFCNKIRKGLDISSSDKSLMDSMADDSKFLEDHWDIMGKIVLPYVYGGMVVEGPQSTIKNAFVVGFFLGSLKEKQTSELKNWGFGEKFLNDLKF